MILTNNQKKFINIIKEKIRQTKYDTIKSINKELIYFY